MSPTNSGVGQPQQKGDFLSGLATSLLGLAMLAGCSPVEPPVDSVSTAAAETSSESASPERLRNRLDATANSTDSIANDSTSNDVFDDNAYSNKSAPTADEAWSALIDAVRREESVAILYRGSQPDLEQLAEVSGKLLDLLLDGGGAASADVEQISSLNGLFHLRIRQFAFTDADALKLVGTVAPAPLAASLEILNLPQARLTGQGISELSKLPKLRQLRLGGSLIDDDAARGFSRLPNLESLHLIGPRISGDGLRSLIDCNKLSSLYIDDCPLPDDAWEALFAAKPSLHVHIDQAHHDRDPKAHKH
ncbi:MAG: hypothetical protein AAGG44_01745 [Planctomycetota bacterium]